MKKLIPLAIVLALATYYVWPTPFQHFDAGEGPYADRTDFETRVNRLSGEVFFLSRGGDWRPLPKESAPHPHQANPVTEPYTRVDVGEAQRQRKQAAATQKMVDQATSQARSRQTPGAND